MAATDGNHAPDIASEASVVVTDTRDVKKASEII